jgi:hypothetical protein
MIAKNTAELLRAARMQEVPRDDEMPAPGGFGISVASAARRSRVSEKVWAMNERRSPSAALTQSRLSLLTDRPVVVMVGETWVAMVAGSVAIRLGVGESVHTRAASLLALMLDVEEAAALVSGWAVGPGALPAVPRGSIAEASKHLAMLMMLDPASAESMLGRLAEMRPRSGTVIAELASAVGVDQSNKLEA